ncbi:MAG: tetratricopeptide repeat protein, partial [Sedimentisphaerales bacterium]|nr:tetratricopeptide repeat protein [Sedimentisphaerales bacterium]
MRQNWKHLTVIAAVLSTIYSLGAGKITRTGEARAAAPVGLSERGGREPSAVDAGTNSMVSGHPLYRKAVELYGGGRYAEAMEILAQIVDQRDVPAEIAEDALRKLADCAYFLGANDGQKFYNQAIQYYHKILAMYPDVRAGNDLVHYRLAKSYELMRNSQAAAEQFNALITNYPLSTHLQDVFLAIADIAEKEGKLEYAINEYRSYLFRNPDAKYARDASFMIGACYYRLGQPVNAELWFRTALKKWPDLKELPRKILRDLGFHNYQTRHYVEAISFLTLYLSLYPKDGDSPYVMYSLAHALAGM